jgi:hypothetical protein
MRTPLSAAEPTVRVAVGRPRGPRRFGVLVGFLALLLTRPGGATIVTYGDQAFLEQVAAAIVKISDSDPSKKALIDGLSNSTHTITIVKTFDHGSHTNGNDNKAASTKGVGTDATVHWNPSWMGPHFCGGTSSDPTAALFHELVHASHFDTGTLDLSSIKGPDGPIEREEVAATVAENMFRMIACLPLRTCYGPQRLPQSPPSTAPCSTTTSTTATSTTTTTNSMIDCSALPCHGSCGAGQTGDCVLAQCVRGAACGSTQPAVCVNAAGCTTPCDGLDHSCQVLYGSPSWVCLNGNCCPTCP